MSGTPVRKRVRQRTKEVQARCTAHSSRTGNPCRQSPIRGGTVCRFHGGSAPQVRRKAQERLLASSDKMAALLIHIAEDKQVPYATRLAAVNSVLDRVGINAKTEIDVNVQTWEQILHAVIVDVPESAIPVTPTDDEDEDDEAAQLAPESAVAPTDTAPRRGYKQRTERRTYDAPAEATPVASNGADRPPPDPYRNERTPRRRRGFARFER